jgi:hypothetical protein
MEERKPDKVRRALEALTAKAITGDISALIKVYRFFHPPRDETGERPKERLALAMRDIRAHIKLDADACDVARSLSNAFAYTIGRFILTSPDPANEAQRIFGRTKRGRKVRSLVERIDIASSVQCLRDYGGFSLEQACQKIAETTCPRISRDAVRRIYENMKRSPRNAPLLNANPADMMLARANISDADF